LNILAASINHHSSTNKESSKTQKSMVRLASVKETPEVHKDLEGFEIGISPFGEIISNLKIDDMNRFLNKNVVDKKLKDRTDIKMSDDDFEDDVVADDDEEDDDDAFDDFEDDFDDDDLDDLDFEDDEADDFDDDDEEDWDDEVDGDEGAADDDE